MTTASREEAAGREPEAAEQFDDLGQQMHADTMGMWIFLATELLMFGAVFMAFAVNRWLYPEAFAHAANHLNLTVGSINMAVLLTSGLTMTLAGEAAAEKQPRLGWRLLGATALLGIVFLCLKGYSYRQEYLEGLVPFWWLTFSYTGPNPDQAQLFFNIYYILTGMHAVHVIVGVAVLLIAMTVGWRRSDPETWVRQIRMVGLFWGFVVVLNVFVFTAMYLLRA